MSKITKIIIILAIVATVIFGLDKFNIISLPNKNTDEKVVDVKTEEKNNKESEEKMVQIANPASEFCIKQGGTLEIKDEENGQTGYCKLKDGTVVEEWEYFKTNNKIETENIEPKIEKEVSIKKENTEKKIVSTKKEGGKTTVETKPQVNKTYKNDEPFTNIEGEEVEKVTLKVVGNKVYMNGTIDTDTPKLFRKVFAENPQIDTLEMLEVPGSLDDEANLEIAKWISKKGLTFILEKNGDIASGGTDFFLAGKKRIIHKGAKVGVHSWSEGEDGKTAKDYPRDSKEHQPYIDYYQAIGWNEADSKKFYYFTIDSATAHGMHSMTEQEMIDYKITTEGKIR